MSDTLWRCKNCGKIIELKAAQGFDGSNDANRDNYEMARQTKSFCVCGKGGAAGTSGTIGKHYNYMTGVFE